ncbi:hypothetical protein M9H77_36378 [Catharanthus roseus]|uniref:Uncharacterized protein n=1 Tax=Catharanthus roseus TaxID=4058 RepID=A0ACB9ZS11_CATRO|nr:hypothetical protein M9H77_36378 [Catharanthus roseus]
MVTMNQTCWEVIMEKFIKTNTMILIYRKILTPYGEVLGAAKNRNSTAGSLFSYLNCSYPIDKHLEPWIILEVGTFGFMFFFKNLGSAKLTPKLGFPLLILLLSEFEHYILGLFILGLDISFSATGYMCISTIISVFVHEVGHALAAARLRTFPSTFGIWFVATWDSRKFCIFSNRRRGTCREKENFWGELVSKYAYMHSYWSSKLIFKPWKAADVCLFVLFMFLLGAFALPFFSTVHLYCEFSLSAPVSSFVHFKMIK